ncbi:hypothetical protein MKEN_00240400 [Mycena kentingensis (nom. inval.)]|nr:hypothetical protein MKEN_00240400 [Mycena kentingensis (nom. inval.)]
MSRGRSSAHQKAVNTTSRRGGQGAMHSHQIPTRRCLCAASQTTYKGSRLILILHSATPMANIYSYPQLDAYAVTQDLPTTLPITPPAAPPPLPPHALMPMPSAAGPARTQHSTRRRGPGSPYELPMDAPTAMRTYATPSLTSRKDIPAFFAARRPGPGSHSSDGEEDELTEEPPAANATDQEKIEYKRRQNTLAARRSRKRKLMHQQALEEAVERLTREKEIWRTRALMLSNLLRSHGITCPDFLE